MKTNSNTSEVKKDWHVTESQMITILECAKWALRDAELFDDIADHLDIQDEEMKEIQEKVNDDPAMMHVVKCVNTFPELVAALQDIASEYDLYKRTKNQIGIVLAAKAKKALIEIKRVF